MSIILENNLVLSEVSHPLLHLILAIFIPLFVVPDRASVPSRRWRGKDHTQGFQGALPGCSHAIALRIVCQATIVMQLLQNKGRSILLVPTNDVARSAPLLPFIVMARFSNLVQSGGMARTPELVLSCCVARSIPLVLVDNVARSAHSVRSNNLARVGFLVPSCTSARACRMVRSERVTRSEGVFQLRHIARSVFLTPSNMLARS